MWTYLTLAFLLLLAALAGWAATGATWFLWMALTVYVVMTGFIGMLLWCMAAAAPGPTAPTLSAGLGVVYFAAAWPFRYIASAIGL
jgi:hypothetical protein